MKEAPPGSQSRRDDRPRSRAWRTSGYQPRPRAMPPGTRARHDGEPPPEDHTTEPPDGPAATTSSGTEVERSAEETVEVAEPAHVDGEPTDQPPEDAEMTGDGAPNDEPEHDKADNAVSEDQGEAGPRPRRTRTRKPRPRAPAVLDEPEIDETERAEPEGPGEAQPRPTKPRPRKPRPGKPTATAEAAPADTVAAPPDISGQADDELGTGGSAEREDVEDTRAEEPDSVDVGPGPRSQNEPGPVSVPGASSGLAAVKARSAREAALPDRMVAVRLPAGARDAAAEQVTTDPAAASRPGRRDLVMLLVVALVVALLTFTVILRLDALLS